MPPPQSLRSADPVVGGAGTAGLGGPGWRGVPILARVVPALLVFSLSGCGEPSGTGGMGEVLPRNGAQAVPEDETLTGVRLLRLAPAGPEYPNARLGLLSPEPGARLAVGEAVEITFGLTGFELGVSTPEAEDRGLARAHGQYVSLVVNDEAYHAVSDLSEPVVLEGLPAGTHAIRAFPARDWHEGVKTPGALVQRLVVVGEGEPSLPPPEEWGATLIYSRPQGRYTGTDADSILVDFYLSGVRLSEEGARVRLQVNGSREFLIHDWAPHVLVGLPSGDHTLRMDLVGPDGARIRSPFTPVERIIAVERDD